jgi:hypothetical protein
MPGEPRPQAASVLSVYGQRKAAIAVGTRSWNDLRMGLIGIGMAEVRLDDYRDNLIVLAVVNHIAAAVDTSLHAPLNDIYDIIPSAVASGVPGFRPARCPGQVNSRMCLKMYGSGEDFTYVSAREVLAVPMRVKRWATAPGVSG